ncbi:MAG: hypothetical protein RL748_2781 [Pseudomonadota bacterium]|jgi:uncharacterized protein
MKLHATATQTFQTVTAYDTDSVDINARRYTHSVLLMPELPPEHWEINAFEQLRPDHFRAILAHNPELIILGTGSRQHFIHPRLQAEVTGHRIGLESMDNQAACRTYNILMAEGRKVALALILPSTASQS